VIGTLFSFILVVISYKNSNFGGHQRHLSDARLNLPMVYIEYKEMISLERYI
jgi:hypothetical protein